MNTTPEPRARATIVAKDVRGVVKSVELDDFGTSSIDDVRRAIARAYGFPEHRARVCATGRDGELRGTASWASASGDATEVMVFGFAAVKTRRRRRERRETTATRGDDDDVEDAERDANGASDRSYEIVTGAGASTSEGGGTRACAALRRLSAGFEAITRACMFLHRQHMQPTMRVIASAVKDDRVTVDDARAMSILCPGSIRLIKRRKSAENDEEEIVVDVTAPDEDGPSAFVTPRYLTNLSVGDDDDDASAAVALQGARRSMRSIGGYSRLLGEMTNRFGANFNRALATFATAFDRGLREVIEHVPFDVKEDTNLREILDAVLEIRAAESAATRNAPRGGLAVPPEAMDRPPAPPRIRAKRKKQNADDGPCCSTEPMDVDTFVDHLKTTLASSGQIAHVENIPAKPAARTPLASKLSDVTLAAFASAGIDIERKLFSHQARAIETVLDEREPRKHVIVASGTASGKSVCYNVPTIETLLADPTATALYMFPTKALAQDQLRALRNILSNIPRSEETVFEIGMYDGDVREDARTEVRENARLIITNPDMLHVSMLPSHKAWARVLSGLRYVVVDEAHAYSGVFGSHVALIIRRLRRLCSELYGSSPQFIISSATVANPLEHARDLIGYDGVHPERDVIEAVTNDGAPRGVKTFLLWNPMLKPGQSKQTNTERKFRRETVIERGKAALARRLREQHGANENVEDEKHDENDAKDGARTSPVVEISQLLAECVQHNLRCLAFCKTRKLCELVLVYTREILRSSAPHLADKVASYRGGYEAIERRAIEKELFSGVLLGVATTNALELGIDVGSLDVTLHLGFPGSVASLWQQAGRAGRREGHALSVYVAFDGPLDQHFMRQPRALFDAPLEMSYVWAENPTIVEQHLACAAYERPLFANPDVDEVYFGPKTREIAGKLLARNKLMRDARSLVAWDLNAAIAQPLLAATDKTPALDVSVRTIEEERYEVIDIGGAREKVIASIEASKAFFEVYEGAVYTHQGRTLLCTKLDIPRRRAFVRMADVKYFTRVKHETTCAVPGGMRAYEETKDALSIKCDQVDIRTTFTGFSRVARGSQAKFDHEAFPPRTTEFRTVGTWLRIPDDVVTDASDAGIDLRAGVHAASHALLNALPLSVPCGDADVGCECFSADLYRHTSRYAPFRFLIYDRHLGGVGIAKRASALFPDLARVAVALVEHCACARADGCPRCVQRLSCDAHNAHINKKAALWLLRRVFANDLKPSDCVE